MSENLRKALKTKATMINYLIDTKNIKDSQYDAKYLVYKKHAEKCDALLQEELDNIDN